MPITPVTSSPLATAALVFAVGAPAAAQDLQYSTVTKVDLGRAPVR